jgi:plastocyanin
MHARCSAGVALAVMAGLAMPAGAHAVATKTVQVGPFGTQAKKFQAAFGDANQYFRRTVTVHKGDKVVWKMNGFHSVTFAAEGEPAPGLVAPDPANLVAGVKDAAGDLFWFNGQPRLAVNPLAVAPQGGKTFDPSVLENSGLPLAPGAPPPYKLRFKTKGTFDYLCVLHPGMEGTVRVVGRGRRIPTVAKDKRVARREQKAALARVLDLSTGAGTESLVKTIQAGNDEASGATVFKFFPAAPSYKVGDTVTLQMSAASSEAHTFSFGPTNGQNLYLDQLAAAFLGAELEPRGAYPSDPPPAVPSYSGTNHGNGFFNSGILDADAATPQPSSAKVTFTAPGSFSMICLIHPFMTATVTVTP